MGIKLNTPDSIAAAEAALRQKIRNELILNKPPQGVMAGLYKKIPTNIRLLAENIAGVDRPITNRDFTNDELVEMAFLAQKQREANARKEKFLIEQQEFDVYPEQKAETKKRLQSFEDTRGKTSVNPYNRVGDERLERGRRVDKGYFDAIKSSFTDPRYGVATTLGKYNVRQTPKMDIIDDTYNFNKAERSLPYNPILALQRIVRTPEVAGEYLANILGTEDRQVRVELEKKPEYPINFSEGGGVMGAFNAPPASQEMFKELADKTNVFTDPLGNETLGAINRAIVGAPVDAIDMMGRAGETVLRGAAKAGTGIMKALGENDAMAERFGRDIYQAGMVSGPATAFAPIRPRGKSNKALVLEAQKEKMKSPAGKRALDENLEEAAITDAFADAADDMTVMYARNTGRMDDEITNQDMLDILTDSYFTNRDRGMSKSDSIAESLFESGLSDVAGPMLKRLDADYNFRSSSAVNRKREGAASRRSLETQARLARQPQESIKTVPLEEATRMQNEISGMGLPDRTVPEKPTLVVIEGGKD